MTVQQPSGQRQDSQRVFTPKLLATLAVLWITAAFTQSRLDGPRAVITPAKPGNFVESLRNNMFGASMLGFREVAAGMLWVKADELFHAGKYLELVPYFQLVTFLDPHQIDVYSTGAWHLSYNFMDNRMVPQSKAFLREGIRNNSTVWDLYFQLGWLNFDWPVEDYEEALPWFREAATKPGTDGGPAPRYVRHMEAHTLARQGRVDEAVKVWQECIAYAEKEMAKAKASGKISDRNFWSQERDVSRNNRDLVLVRKAARSDVAKNPLPVWFSARVSREKPYVLRVAMKLNGLPEMRDSYNEVCNARVELRLEDADYDRLVNEHLNDLGWIGKNLTRYRTIYNIVEADGTVTEGGKPYQTIDLNKDPGSFEPPRKRAEIFPLKSDRYNLVLRFDPRVRRQPETVQDLLGWTGEGLKPNPQVKAEKRSHVVELRIPLTREQIVGEGKADLTPASLRGPLP